MKPCPTCGSTPKKVIYAGLPTLMCEACDPPLCYGGFAWLMQYLPYNGWFLEYEEGYWPALWYWLTSSPEDDDED